MWERLERGEFTGFFTLSWPLPSRERKTGAHVEKERVIELLNTDLQDEHGAIIQYLCHAYGIGEGELACEIEAISREEMRHLDWLAEMIVELGGQPSLTRGKMK